MCIFCLIFQINVACLVLSKDVIKSTAIRDTWGSHCNSLKFVSSKKLKVDEELRKKNTSILVTNPVQVDHVPALSEFGLLCKSLRKFYNNKLYFISNNIMMKLILSKRVRFLNHFSPLRYNLKIQCPFGFS